MQTDRAATDYKLKVKTGEEVEYYDLRGSSVTVGRARENNLVIRDGRLSRMHCRLEQSDDGWRVVDGSSQNGTYVNGRRVRRAALKPGDVIQVGGTHIVIERKSPAEDDGFTETQTVSGIRVADGIPFEDEDLHAEMLMRMQRIASALNSELNLDKLLNLIVDNAITLTGGERGFLILVGRDEMRFRAARNFEQQDISSPEFAVSWSIATQVSTSGEAVLCVNAGEDERFDREESVLSLGLRSVMCVPFKVRKRVIGVVYVDNRLQQGAFSKTDFRVLEMLADHAAIALENARLYAEVVDQKGTLEDMNRRLHLQVEEQDTRLRAAYADGGARDGARDGLIGRSGQRGALIGESSAARELVALIRKVASSDLPVLITGDSGVGKEVVARAVHALSRRAERKMVSENCCAIPESLLESELFGYKKGAFTGANADREGLFVTASGGTLYLDEIGDMSLNLQTKLLRVLQENEVRPLGSEAPRQVDVRLVTSTNRDLQQMIKTGEFREDLFYRIKVVAIEVAPLRERKEDIPLLVEHFLTLFAQEGGGVRKTISKDAVELLKAYAWPGNIRELENELRTMISLGGNPLEKVDVPSHIQEQVELLVGEESGFHDLNELIESIESREITKALRRVRGNKTRAAELLGISRFALQRKLEKYAIDWE